MREDIRETRFDNGLVVLTDHMPGVRSVTLGFYFRLGSRHEPDELNGITHFIEHAVFKGTKRRSALDIAIEQDRLGGTLEAFTTHEETGFAVKVIDDQIESAFDLLADMLFDPQFDENEMRSEQRVIIEELKMMDDSPDDHINDIFSRAFYPGHPLGLNIAGTPKTVRTFLSSISRKYHRAMLRAGNLVLVAAGNVDHDRFVKLVTTFLKKYAPKSFWNGSASKQRFKKMRPPKTAAPIVIKQRPDLEQAHLILATPFISGRDSRRYAADLLALAIGGGTSSRLWQTIREERGLAYGVSAHTIMFADTGTFMVAAGTSPEQTLDVVDIALNELRNVARDGITIDELKLAKDETRASVLLSLEDSASRAAALALSEILHGRQIAVEESLANTEAVTLDEVRTLAREFFRTELVAFAALGDVKGLKVDRKRLAI